MTEHTIAPGLPGAAPYVDTRLPDPHAVRSYPADTPQPSYTPARAAVAAAQNTPPPPPDNPNRVRLSRAYPAHGDQVSEIVFREPVGRDVTSVGVPFRFVQAEDDSTQGEMKIIAQLVTRYIVELSQPPLPRSTVDQFSIADWNACSQVICGFFQR